jgi:uncharacterized membrane protein
MTDSFQEALMEQVFKTIAGYLALGIEAAAALLIAIGAAEALVHVLPAEFRGQPSPGVRRDAWIRFALWLMLGLEFELGADVIRTAISPTWNDIGQLGAIATIRTVLNYFLEKDVEKYGDMRKPGEEPKITRAA